MTREGIAWIFTFVSGFATGAFVTALACGRLRRAGQFLVLGLVDQPVTCSRPRPPRPPHVRLVHDDERRL